MDHVSIDLTRFTIAKRRKVNPIWELCAFAALRWNSTSEKQVTPTRFLKDCYKHQKAYELAQIDYGELSHYCTTPEQQAKLYFGCLKKRKL